jgi:hypothetical protein
MSPSLPYSFDEIFQVKRGITPSKIVCSNRQDGVIYNYG